MNGITMKTMYTFVFVVSLLLIVVRSDSSSRSYSHGENPLSFLLLASSTTIREQQKDRATNQLASLQAYHQHNIQTLVRQVQQRHLQSNTTTNTTTPTFTPTTAPTQPLAPTTCNATTGLVNFNDDDINANLFGTAADIYDSSCFCEEESNSDEVGAILGQLDSVNLTAFVEGFNAALGELFFYSNYSCMTQCEVCFDSFDTTATTQVCGLFSVEDSARVKNKKGNFTLEEIFAITTVDWNELVDTAAFYTENCVQYTGDAYGNSKVCFSADVVSVVDDNEPLYCNITYNDVICSSCIISDVPTNANSTSNSSSTNEEGCLIADCTNVDATYGTMIDLCQNTGLTGPFQFLSLPDIANDTTFTPGTCDGDTVPDVNPTVPTTTSPVVVTSPSSSTADIPTAAPVLISGPAVPTKSNTTNTTKAPVRAPVTTPVLPAPTTSGTTRTVSMTLSMSVLVVILTFDMCRSTIY